MKTRIFIIFLKRSLDSLIIVLEISLPGKTVYLLKLDAKWRATMVFFQRVVASLGVIQGEWLPLVETTSPKMITRASTGSQERARVTPDCILKIHSCVSVAAIYM